MTKNKENNDIYSLKDDKCSLKFTFNQNIRIEGFPENFDRN